MILLAAGTARAFPGGGLTLVNLDVTHTGTLRWYNAPTGGTEYITPATKSLINGTTYYASQTVNGIESTARLAITVTVNTTVIYYADADGDNYGNPSVTQATCTGAPTGYVTNSLDCNDANASVHPVSVAAIAGGASTVCVGSTTPAFTDATADGTWSILPGSGTASIDGSGIVTGATAGIVTVKYTNANWCGSEATTSVTVNPCLATVTTTAITTGTTIVPYTSGGNVTNTGGSAVTDRGICWSYSSDNPTIANGGTTGGSGTGSFTNTFIGGLIANKTYYVRAYATNSDGTAYGNVVSFPTGATGTFIGEFRDDGIVFRTNGSTGLIAARSDQGRVEWGCSTLIGTSTAFGSGQANTTAILNGCNTPGIAARLCVALGTGWYMPSQDELSALYTQKAVFGNFDTGTSYFSSSEVNSTQVHGVWFYDGTASFTFNKSNAFNVRAIRSF